MAFLTMEVSGRYARARAITRDTVSAANRAAWATRHALRDVARVVSDVSVLCPRTVARADNRGPEQVAQPTRHCWQCTSATGLPSISLDTQSTSFSPLTSSS
jgi:hypothetical protein